MYNTTTHQHTNGHADGITIRLAGAGDRGDLRILAERDSRDLPAGPMLVAIVNGRISAAAPVTGEQPISDPFIRSGELVALLTARVNQLHGRDGRGLRSRLGRLRVSLSV